MLENKCRLLENYFLISNIESLIWFVVKFVRHIQWVFVTLSLHADSLNIAVKKHLETLLIHFGNFKTVFQDLKISQRL